MFKLFKSLFHSGKSKLQKKVIELETELKDLKNAEKSRKITIDPERLVLKRNGNGNYSIIAYCKKPMTQVIIATYKDTDDEYAKNCTQESLEYLRRKI